MKVLVTGGTGYLGTHVRRHFAADDVSRRSGFDVLDPYDTVAVQSYDVVIHLAAMMDKSAENEDVVFRTNVEGTINLLREMRPDTIFIFASTKDIYGRFADNYAQVNEECPTHYTGQSPLEWSKLIAERYVEYFAQTRRFRACIFRLSTVYAPRTEGTTPNLIGHLIDALNTGEPIALPGKGRPVRDLMHVDDLSSACQAFIDSVIRYGVYNLGGGPANAISMSGLIQKLEEISGLQAVIDETAELPDPVPFNYVSDIQRVRQELGWDPRIGLDEGLQGLFR
jgi:CDP-paratose 2-epimerase